MILLIGRKIHKNKAAFTQPFLKHSKTVSERAGFTLIELILTSLILLIVIGISIPIFKNTFSDLRINLQVKDTASVMNLAREKAIMTRSPHYIKIDTEKKSYRILELLPEEEKPLPVKGRWGRKFYIHNSLEIEVSDETIIFFQDGSSSGGSITFKDTAGFTRQINVRKSTGEIIVGKTQE